MTDIVIDTGVGSFSLSQEGREYLFQNARDKFFRPEAFEHIEGDEVPIIKARVSSQILGPDYKWAYGLRYLSQRPHAKPKDWWYFVDGSTHDLGEKNTYRTHPAMLRAARKYGGSDIKVLRMPDDIDWYLHEDEGGSECIHEQHRVWT